MNIFVWCVYWNPSDYLNKFVARLWVNQSPTDSILVSEKYEIIESLLHKKGLQRMTRFEADDPCIREVWI